MKVAAGRAEAEIREKGSVFLAVLLPAADEAAVREALEQLARRFPDATHHCYAWRLGWPPRERSADAGEPGGTAGIPILRVLQGAGLSDVLAVVVRWFGGTKLGKGGLARAYAAAAREALARLEVAAQVPTVHLTLEVSYAQLGAVKRRLRPPEVEIESAAYDGETARLTLRVQEPALPGLREALAELQIAEVAQLRKMARRP